MEKSELVKKFITVYTHVERKCLHSQFIFPGGGKVHRDMETFIDRMQKEFGHISDGRIVDYCVCMIHYRKGLQRAWKPNLSFGQKSIQKYIEFKNGKKYFEDQWLKECGTNRLDIESLISQKSIHPLSPYIYLESEEQTKRRSKDLKLGIMMCERSTLLYTPFSGSCINCEYNIECKLLTQKLYPELYRIRIEKWQKTK